MGELYGERNGVVLLCVYYADDSLTGSRSSYSSTMGLLVLLELF